MHLFVHSAACSSLFSKRGRDTSHLMVTCPVLLQASKHSGMGRGGLKGRAGREGEGILINVIKAFLEKCSLKSRSLHLHYCPQDCTRKRTQSIHFVSVIFSSSHTHTHTHTHTLAHTSALHMDSSHHKTRRCTRPDSCTSRCHRSADRGACIACLRTVPFPLWTESRQSHTDPSVQN